MAKHTDYFATLSTLANMAITATSDVSAQQEMQAQSLLDSLIVALSNDWMPPIDREDLALLGQGLVRLARMVGDATFAKQEDRAIWLSCLQPLPLWMERMADIHKLGTLLPDVMAHDRHMHDWGKQISCLDTACFDALREITDAVIGIVLKYG